MKLIYDEIGANYSVIRSTDPKIAAQLCAELNGAKRIVNIDARTGSYEPEGADPASVEAAAGRLFPSTYPTSNFTLFKGYKSKRGIEQVYSRP